MPITITLPPSGEVGPGIHLALQSSLIGPLPTGSFWRVVVSTDSEGTRSLFNLTFPFVGQSQTVFPFLHDSQQDTVGGLDSAQPGASVFVVTQLVEAPNTIVDSGSIPAKWNPSSSLPQVISDTQGTAGSGLTAEQALQLQQAQQATWPQHLVDQLVTPLVGHGSAGAPVAGNLGTPVFGVIVRLTQVPEELQPQTPDGLYWVKTLASVLIFRGSDIWLRVPIHTPSKLINLWMEGLALGLADAVLNAGWLLNLSIQVFFLEGVEGDVFLMRVP